MDSRKTPRFRTRFDALFSSGPSEGSAVLSNLSYSGASLENVTMWPDVGTEVRLYVFIQPVAPFEIVGRVVRKTETGFAIAHEIDDPELRNLVDDVAAIVSVPR
jgi:hypothetical protein